jgi:hypothetical protein
MAAAAAPKIEFLWWRDCPSWDRALAMLRAEVHAAGLDPEGVDVIEVRDEDHARSLRFPGSPTIRVAGADIENDGTARFGLTCRVYRRADGRVSPLPDPGRIRTALRAARGEGGSPGG